MLNQSKKHIVFIGVGIKFYAHITHEALSHIKSAQKLYYLVNEPGTIEWLKSQNASAESLHDIYFSSDKRIDSYQNISDKIISEANNYDVICIVMYGHPLVLNLPTKLTLESISKNNLDINIEVIPGISAESNLYCDLGIDPGVGGVQSYEATEFLIYKKIIDTSSHLILWQLGIIGATGKTQSHNNERGILLLTEYLLKYYPHDHEITLYQASQYMHIKPLIQAVPLSELNKQKISQLVTGYIAPLINRAKCAETLKLLNEHESI